MFTPESLGRVHEPDRPQHRPPGSASGERDWSMPRHPGHHRDEVLDRADHVVPKRTQIAPVVELEELRPEGRDVDLDRALAGAGLAGEAAVERLLDLVREVRLAAAAREGVAEARSAGCASLPSAAQAPALLDRVEALRRELAQPFPHQLRPALRRVPPLPRALPGRAHRVVRIPVVAGAVAVAVERLVEAGPDPGRDGAVERRPSWARRRPRGARSAPAAAILPGLSWFFGSNDGLDRLERRIERPEEFRRELRAHALAVLAPEQAAVLAGDRRPPPR